MKRKRANEKHFEEKLLDLVFDQKKLSLIQSRQEKSDFELKIMKAKLHLIRAYSLNINLQKREWISEGVMPPDIKRTWG